jgi:arginine-tRNA-protein transferase
MDSPVDKLITEFSEYGIHLDRDVVSAALSVCDGDIHQCRQLLLLQFSPEDRDKYYSNLEKSKSFVSLYGESNSECGYCKQSTGRWTFGMSSRKLFVEHYQWLLDRGWRRSGTWLYKPLNAKACCPQYTIRLDVRKFKPNKKQRKVLKNFQRFLQTGEIKQSKSASKQSLNRTPLSSQAPTHTVSSTTSLSTPQMSPINATQNELNELLRSALQMYRSQELPQRFSGFKLNDEKLWKKRGHFTTGASLAVAAQQLHLSSGPSPTFITTPATTTTTAATTTTTATTTTASATSGTEIGSFSSHDPNVTSSQTSQSKKQKSETQTKVKDLAIEIAKKLIDQMSRISPTGKYSFILSDTGHINVRVNSDIDNALKISLADKSNEIQSKHNENKKSEAIEKNTTTSLKIGDAKNVKKMKTQDVFRDKTTESTSQITAAHTFQMRLIKSQFIEEEYQIFRKYQMIVHKEDESEITKNSFIRFLVKNPLVVSDEKDPANFLFDRETNEQIMYGAYHQQYILDGKVIAVGVLDMLPNCLSSVYFFYDPEYSYLNLGVLSALFEIDWTKKHKNLSDSFHYYYLGYYIHSCTKMRYKGQYKPSDLLCPETYRWVPLEMCTPLLEKQKYCRLFQPQSNRSKNSDDNNNNNSPPTESFPSDDEVEKILHQIFIQIKDTLIHFDVCRSLPISS